MTPKVAEEYDAVDDAVDDAGDDAGDDARDDACMVVKKLPKKPRLTIFLEIYALCLIFFV
jgi:hypothetical protein